MPDHVTWRETARFTAHGTDGRRYTIIERTTEPERDGTGMATPRWDPAMKEYRTTGEQRVIRLDTGLYQLAATGILLRADSPNAP